MNRLFSIENNELVLVNRKSLDLEKKIENWVCSDLSLIGIDGIVIGQQVRTDHNKPLDILAMDQKGNLIIIELKRDKTPRDIVAQVLDYASWVCKLMKSDIINLFQSRDKKSLSEIYKDKFDTILPEVLNRTHQMIIVASEFDSGTKRIVEYLSEQHDVGINASFFNIFQKDNTEWLVTDTLLEQEEVTNRAEKKIRGDFSGYYYVTGGTNDDRPWEDLKQYGFITASGGTKYTNPLSNLSIGNKIFYYQKGNGYLGYGEVITERQVAYEFRLPDNKSLPEIINKHYLTQHRDNYDYCAYVVGVKWLKTFDVNQAKTFKGIFANQNVVCKLYQTQQETIDFLIKEFDVPNVENNY